MISILLIGLSLFYGLFRSPLKYIIENEVSSSMVKICRPILYISDLMYLLTYIQFISFSRSIDEVLIDIMIYVLFFILGIVISKLTKLEKLFNTLK